jgi:hypothetical protein
MAAPSVTYSFSNSTTADATQVNQNFTDIINGLSDGTKDLTINALTCAGAVSMQGHVTLGNGTPDDITVSGSLASSIPIKTTFSYDVGTSTIGLRSIYFGSNDSAARTTRVIAGAVGSSYTLTLPTGAGSAGQVVRNLGSGSLAFSDDAGETINLGLAASVGSSALTVALKGADGNDASSTNPVYIKFRNATLTTGTPVTRTITGALSVVASSGSTLGHKSAVVQYVYVYAIDNAGTVELAVSGQKLFEEGGVVSTTAEGGAGAADSGTVLYSTTARSNVACRLIGRLKSTQATAGTWATAIAEIAVGAFEDVVIRSEVYVSNGNAHGSTNNKIRRFTTVNNNTGTAITYADSGTDGASFTINEEGLYAAYYGDTHDSGLQYHGITLNSTNLTTAINSLAHPEALCICTCSTAAAPATTGFVKRLRPGDVVRPHTGGNHANSTVFNFFHIAKVGP